MEGRINKQMPARLNVVSYSLENIEMVYCHQSPLIFIYLSRGVQNRDASRRQFNFDLLRNLLRGGQTPLDSIGEGLGKGVGKISSRFAQCLTLAVDAVYFGNRSVNATLLAGLKMCDQHHVCDSTLYQFRNRRFHWILRGFV